MGGLVRHYRLQAGKITVAVPPLCAFTRQQELTTHGALTAGFPENPQILRAGCRLRGPSLYLPDYRIYSCQKFNATLF